MPMLECTKGAHVDPNGSSKRACKRFRAGSLSCQSQLRSSSDLHH